MDHVVYDENGYRYELHNKLGEGGQGAVFRTQDKQIVVKCLTNPLTGNILKNAKRYASFKARVNEVRLLNLSSDMHLARPALLLREPYCGYVMSLIEDMSSLKTLILPKEQPLTEFYIQTGGLRRRILILSELARILTDLHSRTIVYADLSPENVFISKNMQFREVWLIDTDNLRRNIDFREVIYTPGYAAPEIYTGTRGNHTLSDVYSFARLAYETLTLNPPFQGQLVLNGGGWDDDEDINQEEEAEKGNIPWVHDDDDDSNRSETGIPAEFVLTNGMFGLFQQTFCEKGRRFAASRPSMRAWYDTLRYAADHVLTCRSCGSGYFTKYSECPFCDTPRHSFIQARVVDSFEVEYEEGNVEWEQIEVTRKVLDFVEDHEQLTSEHCELVVFADEVKPCIHIKLDKRMQIYTLKNLMEREVSLLLKEKTQMLRMGETFDFEASSINHVELRYLLMEQRVRHILFKKR